jgi:hypothetical protein
MAMGAEEARSRRQVRERAYRRDPVKGEVIRAKDRARRDDGPRGDRVRERDYDYWYRVGVYRRRARGQAADNALAASMGYTLGPSLPLRRL